MGIPGLTSYINSIEALWTSTALQNTRVVIDGSCFCHYLYISHGLDCRCGGQYREFYNAVVSFFNSLTSKGVEPLVVFDGTFHPSGKKSDTLKKRAEDTIQKSNALSKSSQLDGVFLLPPLSKLVLIQALRDRNINFAICDRYVIKNLTIGVKFHLSMLSKLNYGYLCCETQLLSGVKLLFLQNCQKTYQGI